MQRTGIVPSSPTTACEVPNASWIDGISGPTPTICGRSVSAARNSATSVAVGRCVKRAGSARPRRRRSLRLFPQPVAHQPGGYLDVLARLAAGDARVPRADRVEQLDVALGGLLRVHVGAVERDRDAALDAERLPALLQHRVARRLDDQPVKCDVVVREGIRVVLADGFAHRLELDLEGRHVALEL